MKAVLLPFLFLASAFFSATETALFALRRVDLLKWKEEGNRRAERIAQMLSKPNRLIATIFLGNEIVNVAISSVIAALLLPYLPAGVGEGLALLAATLGILLIGDVTPKCLVWPRARGFSLFAAAPLHAFSRVVAPVRFVLEKIAGGILFLLGERGGPQTPGMTEAEFRALVDAGEETGTLDTEETELIHNIFEMTDRRAGEIMTPLPDVFMIPKDLPYEELVTRYRRYRRSRIPVYEGERHNVVGVLHFKQLLRPIAEGGTPPVWQDLVRPPYVVPEVQKLHPLLREFQRRKVHIAVVVDEYGETCGIVTLEDVLEELFGEILEERDREEREIALRPDGSSLVLGKTQIRHFNEAFGTEIPDLEFDTVAGFLLHEFGRMPSPGEKTSREGISFTVERMKGLRIVEVGVRPALKGKVE
ncbi:MAG: HlyC/CorC family transporter [Deltaproteobacteria bacterium]|nr:MAG: HlyC/CorC family transporter [Deltaproteobacteria bacterium]